jgi:nitroreductase
MNVTEAIFARRSVRAFAPRKVEEPTLRTLLHAAVQAPSAMNRQPWLFSIVQDVAQLKRYSDRAKAMLLAQMSGDGKAKHYEDLLRSDSFNIFYDASTLVVIGTPERGPYTDADCWLAAQNLLLAAWDAGLGSCCIGFSIPVLNTPDVKAELGLPAGGAAVAAVILGYPSATPSPVSRAEPKIASWSR